MKNPTIIPLIIITLITNNQLLSQEADSLNPNDIWPLEQLMEQQTIQTDSEPDFSDWTDELEELGRNPVNLNSNDPEALRRLFLLNEIQIQNLLSYTKESGRVASIYELQWIEGFNQSFIEMITPYISLADAPVAKLNFRSVFRYGHSKISLRHQRVLEKQSGYINVTDSIRNQHPNNYFQGSPDALLLKYAFNYRDQVQFGLLAEKDAGESILPAHHSQKTGFDFYSGYLFLRNLGIVKEMVIGDYRLQFGQGLTLWTGMSMKGMPGQLPMRKRVSPIRPHTSSNENSYLRGYAARLGLGQFELTGFLSNCRRDGNLISADSLNGITEHITSLQETGYHRTVAETEDRKTVREYLGGAHLRYNGNRFRAGATVYRISFDKKVIPKKEEYLQFQPDPTKSSFFGIDYAYSYKRLTLYGEATKCIEGGNAFIQGLNFTPDSRFSMAMVYRNYSRGFKNRYASAFGNAGNNSNEKGLYLGFSSSLTRNVSITASVDYFRFPWLKYRTDSPSLGYEYRIQVIRALGRKGEIIARSGIMRTGANKTLSTEKLNTITTYQKYSYQLQIRYDVIAWLTIINRINMQQNASENNNRDNGFFISQDFQFKPASDKWKLAFRYALFDTDSYDSRIYVFENDLPLSFSIPSFSGGGSRYFILFRFRILKKAESWIRLSRTVYNEKTSISDGPSEINTNHKSELRVMLNYRF